MTSNQLPRNQIIQGDCLEVLASFPAQSVDLVFADPPYNLQLQGDLWRPNMSKVDAVDDNWDRFSSFQAYDAFCRDWLTACRRVLKPNGAIWVIGTYHNIYRIGKIMQDLGFWFLNDIVWVKTNPMPNFQGTRFTNATETLLWATLSQDARYTFNYHAMKAFNDDKQMRSDWFIKTCVGPERIKVNGRKVHSTQKPEALLYRVLLASTDPGDIVLDPFFGTGTTGAVAKKLHRDWIGIEQEQEYVDVARERIEQIVPESLDEATLDVRDRRRVAARVRFSSLLEHGFLNPGQPLYFKGNQKRAARIKPNGRLRMDEMEGTIHTLGRQLTNGSPCNGWEHWYYEAHDGSLHPIDRLREQVRDQLKINGSE